MAKKIPANKSEIGADDLRDFIVNCLNERKASNVSVINVAASTSFAKYMIIASGRSERFIRSLAEYIATELKNKLGHNTGFEGMRNSSWVIVDAGDVILHLFQPDSRDYFGLEEFWLTKNKSEADKG